MLAYISSEEKTQRVARAELRFLRVCGLCAAWSLNLLRSLGGSFLLIYKLLTRTRTLLLPGLQGQG